MSGSEAEVDLVLIQTSLSSSCKCTLVSTTTTWFTQEKLWRLCQNKVNLSLASSDVFDSWKQKLDSTQNSTQNLHTLTIENNFEIQTHLTRQILSKILRNIRIRKSHAAVEFKKVTQWRHTNTGSKNLVKKSNTAAEPKNWKFFGKKVTLGVHKKIAVTRTPSGWIQN